MRLFWFNLVWNFLILVRLKCHRQEKFNSRHWKGSIMYRKIIYIFSCLANQFFLCKKSSMIPITRSNPRKPDPYACPRLSLWGVCKMIFITWRSKIWWYQNSQTGSQQTGLRTFKISRMITAAPLVVIMMIVVLVDSDSG